MYPKILIIASKKDKAGINITTQLSQFGNYKFYLVEEEAIYTKNLDLTKINEYDFIIFASQHQSKKNEKALTIHVPGNWRLAEYGGESGKVCSTSAVFLKQAFELLNKNAIEHHLDNFKITLEATHHGPLIEKPCMFIEIGSTETEWINRRAGFVVAKTIKEIIETFKENPYNEIAIGIGGPHYCPGFNKIQLKSNTAISHIIPSYALPITEEMILEAINKTQEQVDFVLLDWKGIRTKQERENIIKILENNYIQWKKTSEIKR